MVLQCCGAATRPIADSVLRLRENAAMHKNFLKTVTSPGIEENYRVDFDFLTQDTARCPGKRAAHGV
jgi:hypothetical protein